jgi:uncharacterized protein
VISRAAISRAGISQYIGEEIPNWRDLGLDKRRRYRLLRCEPELQRAAASFAGVPVLSDHMDIAADGYPSDMVWGACDGDQIVDRNGFLRSSMTLWSWPGIRGIGQGERCSLSCGYDYEAEMSPGYWDDQYFDGVMRNITGKHVAVVKAGRIPDCEI